MRNRGKNRQRRGLPPPCGIHPAGTGYSCVLLFPALSLVWSHRWFGRFQENACFSGRYDFYRQGLILVCSCSQLPGARLPAVGTPLHQGRPGHGNHPAIGPAAMVAWCGGRTRRHSKGNGPNTSLTQAQPRTPRGVLRGERPKRFFPPFLIGEKWGISGASPPGALVFTRAMVEGPLSQKRRKRAVAGTACNSPQMSVITGTAWTQTAPRRCGQWPRRTCEPRTDT